VSTDLANLPAIPPCMPARCLLASLALAFLALASLAAAIGADSAATPVLPDAPPHPRREVHALDRLVRELRREATRRVLREEEDDSERLAGWLVARAGDLAVDPVRLAPTALRRFSADPDVDRLVRAALVAVAPTPPAVGLIEVPEVLREMPRIPPDPSAEIGLLRSLGATGPGAIEFATRGRWDLVHRLERLARERSADACRLADGTRVRRWVREAVGRLGGDPGEVAVALADLAEVADLALAGRLVRDAKTRLLRTLEPLRASPPEALELLQRAIEAMPEVDRLAVTTIDELADERVRVTVARISIGEEDRGRWLEAIGIRDRRSTARGGPG